MIVAIPTFERPERLASLLRHLYTLDPKGRGYRLQVLVTGNLAMSVDEDCAELIAMHDASYKADLSGLCAAKNYALDDCNGEPVLFVDDDVLPSAAYLRAAEKMASHMELRTDARVGLWTGCPFLPVNRGYHDWSPYPIARPACPPEGYQQLSVRDGRIDFGAKVQVYSLIEPEKLALGYAIGGALLVNPHVTSRFDLFFDRTVTGEEIDFSLSVRAEDYQIVYDPTVHAFHFPSRYGGARFRAEERQRICQANFAYLLQKHGLPPVTNWTGADVQDGT